MSRSGGQIGAPADRRPSAQARDGRPSGFVFPQCLGASYIAMDLRHHGLDFWIDAYKPIFDFAVKRCMDDPNDPGFFLFVRIVDGVRYVDDGNPNPNWAVRVALVYVKPVQRVQVLYDPGNQGFGRALQSTPLPALGPVDRGPGAVTLAGYTIMNDNGNFFMERIQKNLSFTPRQLASLSAAMCTLVYICCRRFGTWDLLHMDNAIGYVCIPNQPGQRQANPQDYDDKPDPRLFHNVINHMLELNQELTHEAATYGALVKRLALTPDADTDGEQAPRKCGAAVWHWILSPPCPNPPCPNQVLCPQHRNLLSATPNVPVPCDTDLEARTTGRFTDIAYERTTTPHWWPPSVTGTSLMHEHQAGPARHAGGPANDAILHGGPHPRAGRAVRAAGPAREDCARSALLRSVAQPEPRKNGWYVQHNGFPARDLAPVLRTLREVREHLTERALQRDMHLGLGLYTNARGKGWRRARSRTRTSTPWTPNCPMRSTMG